MGSTGLKIKEKIGINYKMLENCQMTDFGKKN